MLRYLPLIIGLALVVYALIDCLQTDEDAVRALPKVAWVILILLLPVVGPIAWLVAGRPTRAAAGIPPWGPRQPNQRQRPLGPDDDPDFLNTL